MEIGVVGLGRMGANMARRMARGGARVFAYDRDPEARRALAGEANVECVQGLDAITAQLGGERVILQMVPTGATTVKALGEMLSRLSAGEPARGRRKRINQG